MRSLIIIIIAMFLSACSSAITNRGEKDSSAIGNIPAAGNAQISEEVKLLLDMAAKDFFEHPPAKNIRFKDVRAGYILTSGGEKQHMLFGMFQGTQDKTESDWIPFATIKTSLYEQWNGAQALGFYNDPNARWDNSSDLSSLLQFRFNSLSGKENK